MKTTSLLIALLCLCLVSCNNKQNSEAISADNGLKFDSASEETLLHPKFDENKIHGLGIFKIGVSVENSIGKLLDDGNYKFDSARTRKQIGDLLFRDRNDKPIYKINPPLSTQDADSGITVYSVSLDCRVPLFNWNKDVAVYDIGNYVVDSLELHQLIAFYYRNQLVRVQCGARVEFREAIKSKYGKPDKQSKDQLGPWYTYYNGDLTAGETSKLWGFAVEVRGALPFLDGCSAKARAVEDSIERANKYKGLKNL